MGAGDYPAGDSPAGFDPVESSPARGLDRAPAAVEFDGATRDFVLKADGNFAALHPVDQGVALAILVQKGSIKSAPAIGNELGSIEDLASPRLEQQVRARIDESFPLSTFLADGSVTTLNVEWEVRESGGLLVAYTYRNNLLADEDPVRRVTYG